MRKLHAATLSVPVAQRLWYRIQFNCPSANGPWPLTSNPEVQFPSLTHLSHINFLRQGTVHSESESDFSCSALDVIFISKFDHKLITETSNVLLQLHLS